MVSRSQPISLLVFTQRTQSICFPLKHNDHIHAITEEQVVRSNVFWWPRPAPSVTPFASEVRNLQLDLSISIDGGHLLKASSFDLPGFQVAKIPAVPLLSPKLESLTVNVDNTSSAPPGATDVDVSGMQYPTGILLEAMIMERC